MSSLILNNNRLSGFDIVIRIVSLAVVLGMVLLLLVFSPEQLGITACGFKEATGHSCPTCGLTRSFHALLHFKVIDSIYYHPMGIVLFGFVILTGGRFVYELLKGRSIKLNRDLIRYKYIISAVFIVWFLFWIMRLALE